MMKKNETIKKEGEKMRKTLYIDMDGTCFRFHRHETLDPLFQKGYFRNLEPHENVIEGLRMLKQKYPELKIKIITCCLEALWIIPDKRLSLNKYMDFIKDEDMIFIKYGDSKSKYMETESFLLDDYTPNLEAARQKNITGIKLINDINWNKQTWNGETVNYSCPPWMIMEEIEKIMKLKETE